MSVAALRLIRCRRLSTAGPPGVKKVLQWKDLSEFIGLTSTPLIDNNLTELVTLNVLIYLIDSENSFKTLSNIDLFPVGI